MHVDVNGGVVRMVYGSGALGMAWLSGFASTMHVHHVQALHSHHDDHPEHPSCRCFVLLRHTTYT
jgi:hypothetical protein